MSHDAAWSLFRSSWELDPCYYAKLWVNDMFSFEGNISVLPSHYFLFSPTAPPLFLRKKRFKYEYGRNQYFIIFYQIGSSDFFFSPHTYLSSFPKCEADFHAHFFAGLSSSTEQLQEATVLFRKCALVSFKEIFPLYFWFASEGICQRPSTRAL